MKTKKELGNEIRLIRLARKQSQDDIGAIFEVKQQTIGSWERTGIIPSARWAQVYEVFGLNPEDYEDEEDSSVYIKGKHSNISGHDMHITNTKRRESDLTPEEQTLINILRAKDPTRVGLMRLIAEWAAKEV